MRKLSILRQSQYAVIGAIGYAIVSYSIFWFFCSLGGGEGRELSPWGGIVFVLVSSALLPGTMLMVWLNLTAGAGGFFLSFLLNGVIWVALLITSKQIFNYIKKRNRNTEQEHLGH